MTYEELPHPFPFTCEYLCATETDNRSVIVEEVFSGRFKIRTLAAMTVPDGNHPVRLASGQVFQAAEHELDFSTVVPCPRAST